MNINNLVFFNSKGRQLNIQYNNLITFTIKGRKYTKDREYGWMTDATGHIVMDELGAIKDVVIDKPGASFGFTYDEIQTNLKLQKENGYLSYTDVLHNLIIEMNIVMKGISTETITLKKDDIFKYFDITIGEYHEEIDSDINTYNTVYNIKSVKALNKNFIRQQTLINYYPSAQFLGVTMFEPVATELASVNTLFILEKNIDASGNISYIRPRSDTQNLRFEFPKTSNVKIIKYAEDWNAEDNNNQDISSGLEYDSAYWSNYKTFNLIDEFNDEFVDETEPLVLSLGFISEEEGAYEDIMTCYTVDNITRPEYNLKYNNIGYLTCKAESIGEDERYRTLFTNFGIPDPKYYPEVFANTDIDEEGKDWKFLNKKSKELFLSYTNIFPYVGTYKALINAVKFLGYDDVYFKEWYRYFDGEDEEQISYQSLDINNEKTLRSKLANVNVSFEDFLSWKKLNRLSLIYKLNEEADQYEEAVKFYSSTTPETIYDSSFTHPDKMPGDMEVYNYRQQTQYFEIPNTVFNFKYYNNEILAKLYALKKWLEKYILNVNCQIIDVTGEGVYFERIKEQAYSSGYIIFNHESGEFISPRIAVDHSQLEMKDSTAKISCTLKELGDTLTIKDEYNRKISDYIKYVYDMDTDVKITDSSTIKTLDLTDNRYCAVGNTFENIIPFKDIAYELTVTPESAALNHDVSVSLLIDNNEIYIFDKTAKESEFLVPPIIRIESGELRQPFGKWDKNIKYTITDKYNLKAHRNQYTISSFDNKTSKGYNDYVVLVPGKNAKFKYTKNNKYSVPLFIIENYDTPDHFIQKDVAERYFAKIKADTETRLNDISIYYFDEKQYNNTKGIVFNDWKLLVLEYFKNGDNGLNTYIDASYSEFTGKLRTWLIESTHIYAKYMKDKAEYDKKTDFTNKFILNINDGIIYKKEYSENSDVIVNTNIIFEQDYNIDDNDNEQKVTVEYKYTSPRIPVVAFDISSYIEDYNNLCSEYNSNLEYANNITNFMDTSKYDEVNREFNNIKDVYNSTLNDISTYIYDIDDTLADDLKSYMTNKEIEKYIKIKESLKYAYDKELEHYKYKIDKLNKHSAYKQKLYIENLKSKFTQDKIKLKAKHSISNKYYDISVNHIGDYTLTAKGYDNYNITYVNNADNTENVYVASPNVYINSLNEDNALDTVLYNNLSNTIPTFIPNYRRFITTETGNNEIIYQNYSYNYDTPKENDYIKIDNISERVSNIKVNDDIITVSVLDENIQNQNLFTDTPSEIYLIIIDPNTNDIISNNGIIGPLTTVEKNPIPKDDINEDDQAWIKFSYDINKTKISLYEDAFENVNNKVYECYAINTTQYELTLDNIVNNQSLKESTIYISSNSRNMAFKKDQLIKIMFVEQIAGTSKTSADSDSKTNDRYLSGTTYRIKDAYFDNYNFKQVYVLDGMINTDMLKKGIYNNGNYNNFNTKPTNLPYGVKCFATYSYSSFTSYILTSKENAIEDGNIGSFVYNNPWLEHDFIDNTFSFTIRSFNPQNAFDEFNEYKSFDPSSLFTHDTALTEPFGHSIQVLSDNPEKYMSIWNVYYNNSNDENNKYLYYQVTNDYLNIKPKNKGEYHFELTSLDKFGNKVKNKKQGFLKVI